MKAKIIKLIIITIISFFLLGINSSFSTLCDYDPDITLSFRNAMDTCLSKTDVIKPTGDIDVSKSGFKNIILGWVKSLSIYLSVGAVFSIVYGSLLLTLTGGEDEKVKKGKDIIKWSILGFFGVVFSGVLISVVINFIYSLS